MKLFNFFNKSKYEKEDLDKRKDIVSNVNNNSAEKYSVADAKSIFYDAIASHTGWNSVKSKRYLKKTIGDIVFEINFFSSKWNMSYEIVEVNLDFRFRSKKINNFLGGCYSFRPSEGYWYDISTSEKLSLVVDEVCKKIDSMVLPLCKGFEDDFLGTVIKLCDLRYFNRYHTNLQFLDFYVERDYLKPIIKSCIASPYAKKEVEQYLSGNKSKEGRQWVNPNLDYILDNELYLLVVDEK